ncbi:MAG: hypothetical protein ACXW1W_19040 [Methylococcaceae bacterium]
MALAGYGTISAIKPWIPQAPSRLLAVYAPHQQAHNVRQRKDVARPAWLSYLSLNVEIKR